MNRLHHLKQTLPYNLDCICGDQNHEIIILDYNSTDGLDKWIENNRSRLPKSIKYFKTTTSDHYKRSHSRNMAMRLASGDIICNLDADNFIGEGFIDYISKVFSENQNVFVSPEENSKSDVFGKICFTKNAFFEIGGYDEKIEYYGFEDLELKTRLIEKGLKNIEFNNPDFQRAIQHSEFERIKNEYLFKNLKHILIEKNTPYQSKIVFVLNDNTYESGIVIDDQYNKCDEYIKLLEEKNRYILKDNSVENGILDPILLSDYQIIESKIDQTKLIYFYSQVKNKSFAKTKESISSKKRINKNKIGNGVVFAEFDKEHPIIL
ncbi:glycosyltransferase family 2 protein [Lacihabitans sp. CCS-44]|nr:glycosyltransferase family A protein [Lacihabitans sp. CCS-44]MCP9755889.1 glycosyltransferase family 2 protein [Lacihabitans sp. CCS-44]